MQAVLHGDARRLARLLCYPWDVGQLALNPSSKLSSLSQSLASAVMLLQLCACGLATPQGRQAKKGGLDSGTQEGKVQTTTAGKNEDSVSSSAGEEKDSTAQECEETPGQRCLAPSPDGWEGPAQPQKAKSPEDLQPCGPQGRALALQDEKNWLPDAKNNRYVMELSAEPAQCEACEVSVDLGQCSQATLLRFKVKADFPGQCEGPDGSQKELPITSSCVAISGDEARSGEYALGVVRGISDRKEAKCTLAAQKEAELPPGKAPHYYRICEAQARQGACSGQARCMAFDKQEHAPREGKACIYREGEHACPAGDYQDRRVIYGGYAESRACEACELNKQDGDIRCHYEIGLSKRDPQASCSNPSIVGADTLCLSEEDFLGREAPWAIQELSRKASWSGRCESSEPAAVGKLAPSAPWTLCCTEL